MYDGASSPLMSLIMLGRYRVLRRIGQGSMGGEVWLCEDPSLRRQVAIKTLPFHRHGDQAYMDQFLHGVRSAAALHHPHIVPIHDYGEQPVHMNDQSVSYIVMPYITGGSLAQRIGPGIDQQQDQEHSTHDSAVETNPPIAVAPGEVLDFLQQAAQAIDYAHSRGIIHLDIKPANLLFRDDNWLLLTDFGITPLLSNLKQPRTDMMSDVPYYMAPEQIQGHPGLRSDNYSLAVIAYQLFTGQLPFQHGDASAIAEQHMTKFPTAPHEYNMTLPFEFESILLRGLAKRPEERFTSAQDFVSALRQVFFEGAHRPSSTTLPRMEGLTTWDHATAIPDNNDGAGSSQQLLISEVVVSSSQRPLLTRRHFLLLGGAVLLAGGGLGSWYWAKHQNPSIKPAPSPTGPVPLVLRGHEKTVCSFSWSPQNMLASGGSADGIVCVWDVSKLYMAHKATAPAALKSFDNEGNKWLAWSPKGDMLAIANSGQIPNQPFESTSLVVANSQLNNYAPGFNSPLLVQDSSSINAMNWAPDGTLLTLVNNSNYQDVIGVWNMQSAKHEEQNLTLAFSVNNGSELPVTQLLAVASSTKPLRLAVNGWDTGVYYCELMFSAAGKATLKPYPALSLSQYAGDAFNVGSVAWSADGRFIAAIHDALDKSDSITTWDTQNKNHQSILTLPANVSSDTYVTALAYDRAVSSTRIAGGATDGRVYIWDYQHSTTPVQVLTPPPDTRDAVATLAWSADGQWLAAAYNDVLATVLVWKM